ncbi:MAG: methyltransferase, partial [Planctomycetota bacterium]
WRSQLCFSTVTERLGPNGFKIYAVVFMVLLLLRPVVMIALGISDEGSLPLPAVVRVIVPLLLAVPAIYTLYSVARYFGFYRAMGADHFDPVYRSVPLVKEGIFRFTRHSMYSFGFLLFWLIAFAFASRAALVTSLFAHAYIWVHYFCTEKPDMELIYGPQRSDPAPPPSA